MVKQEREANNNNPMENILTMRGTIHSIRYYSAFMKKKKDRLEKRVIGLVHQTVIHVFLYTPSNIHLAFTV